MSTDLLAAPLTLASGLVLPNRLAKSAMTEALADRERAPSPELLHLYARWASSGAGLLITGNVGIDRMHPVRPRDVILDQHAALAPFRRWAETTKAGGARVVMQLNHAGRQTLRLSNGTPMSASAGEAVPMLGAFGRPRAASEAEIAAVIRAHAEAAARAEHCGFDGVQVHAAHGYLINQFLSPDLNRRQDAWGGDVAGRARLLLEVVRAVRSATKPSFSVLVKLNSSDFSRGGLSEDDALAVVALLNRERIDLLEISGGRYESGAALGYNVDARGQDGQDARAEGYFARFARRARERSQAPIMLTGGLRSAAFIRAELSTNSFDVAGLARPMLLDPDYPRALLAGRELVKFSPPRLGLANLESAAELAFWYAQIARLGHGLSPAPRFSPWRALGAYVLGDALEALRARLRRWRLSKPRLWLRGQG